MAIKPTFTRFSLEGMVALSSLPAKAPILLFTPVIVPANDDKVMHEQDRIDPFEALGRALSVYHKRIRHVPYVPRNGFTETHAAFLSQSDAVIIVMCEPKIKKEEDVSRQISFAKSALDAIEDKEANASRMLVLVQCGSEKFRPAVAASFLNVIDVASYDEETAKQLARAIFKLRH